MESTDYPPLSTRYTALNAGYLRIPSADRSQSPLANAALGSRNQEPSSTNPGEAHTLVITEDSPEPALIIFVVEGGLIYLDRPDNGSLTAYEDGFTLLELCRNHYREAGLDLSQLDLRVR